MTEAEAKDLLIDEDTFLTCGVHIGTKQKSKDMEPYAVSYTHLTLPTILLV